ncbi:hypothetical protein JCM1841_004788 [Sporobolomyces salmonicolor]
MDGLRRLVNGPDGRKNSDMSGGRRWSLVRSYLPDWILTIFLVALIGGLTETAGFKRQFSLNDESIQHTYAVHERITFGECIVYSAIIPAVIIALIGVVWRRSLYDVHNGILGLLLSVSITTVFTQVVKVCVGRPRPDLIDRCQPVEGAANAAVYGLATVAICTVQTGHIIDDGFKSFPSGHSSFAWAGLGYFALYLAGKMHLFDRRGHTIKAWVAVTPLIGATLIAVSRTNYRHHATDVIAGSILGAWVSIITYHLYYPSVFSSQCALPYSPRIPPPASGDLLLSSSSEPENQVLPTHRLSESASSVDGLSHGIPLEANGPDGVGQTAPRPAGGRGIGAAARNGQYYPLERSGA